MAICDRLRRTVYSLLLAAALAAVNPLPAFAAEAHHFEVETTDPARAIHEFGTQSGVQILASAEQLRGKRLNEVFGTLTTDSGLRTLLAGTGLTHRYVGERTVALIERDAGASASGGGNGKISSQVDAEAMRGAEAARGVQSEERSRDGIGPDGTAQRGASAEGLENVARNMPEVLVKGSRSLNMDIRRNRDGPQPYVVFEREQIQRSGAVDLTDFLKKYLPMNTVGGTDSQTGNFGGNRSTINLRGLGANQTLILIDGRRVAGANNLGTPSQPDLNGIPVSAVERIEILPTTASGIYGGSATGGVINVVLRRDYSGAEVQVTYDDTFEGGGALRRVGLGAGFALGAKTQVMFTGSYTDQNPLTDADRGMTERFRSTVLQNNPTSSTFFGTSPPLGATPNIRSANGSNLVLRNGTALNSPRTFVPLGYQGTSTDAGAALVANAGRYNFDLADTAQGSGGKDARISFAPTVKSGTATLRHEWTANLQTFLDVAAENNTGRNTNNSVGFNVRVPANAPNNPFTQAITVTFPGIGTDSELVVDNFSRRATGGVILQLPGEWKTEAEYAWNRTRMSFTTTAPSLPAPGLFNAAIGDGRLDVLRDLNANPVNFSPYLVRGQFTPTPFKTTSKNATLRISGPVGRLPAGRPIVSALIEHRDEELGEGSWFSTPTASEFFPDRSQSIRSAYLEMTVPLLSAGNSVPGVQQLELQLAGRRDEYTIKGVTGSIRSDTPTPVERTVSKLSSTNPTVALRYRATEDVMLRVSYGTGFLPPSVQQLVTSAPQAGGTLGTDPLRGNEAVVATFSEGGNPDLQPEESDSWSAGLVLTPRFMRDFRLSVDYTHIEKENNITNHPGSFQGYINDGFVTRDPVAPGDPFGVGRINNVAFILLNLANSEVEAYDAQLDYRVDTARAGAFDLFSVATWQTHHLTQTLEGEPFVENVGVGSNNPLKLKGNAGVTWNYRNWTLGWMARYFDSYIVSRNATTVLNQGNEGRVPSQTYHDAFAGYRFDSAGSGSRLGGWLSDTEIQLGLKNVFDEEPPFDANSAARPYSLFGDPRGASYYLTLKRSF